jgi:hypothetical protein
LDLDTVRRHYYDYQQDHDKHNNHDNQDDHDNQYNNDNHYDNFDYSMPIECGIGT